MGRESARTEGRCSARFSRQSRRFRFEEHWYAACSYYRSWRHLHHDRPLNRRTPISRRRTVRRRVLTTPRSPRSPRPFIQIPMKGVPRQRKSPSRPITSIWAVARPMVRISRTGWKRNAACRQRGELPCLPTLQIDRPIRRDGQCGARRYPGTQASGRTYRRDGVGDPRAK
jgi:hypothetical protein